ncbi:MAG: ectoine/hydroxyectoine ABC transporter permease subunit EhuC [Burkholderiaceae bacterium]
MNTASYLDALLTGAATTITLTCSSLALATVFAFAAGISLYARHTLMKPFASAYVGVFRGTSLLVQFFWLYYALPLLGFSMSPMATGIIALALNSGAYGAEVVRGAMQAVSKQQLEAARALNFTSAYTLRKIVLPQAVVEMMPSFSSLAVQNLKDTALVSMITIADLAYKAQELRNLTQDTVPIYGLTLLLYFAMALILMFAMRALERKFDKSGLRGARA